MAFKLLITGIIGTVVLTMLIKLFLFGVVVGGALALLG